MLCSFYDHFGLNVDSPIDIWELNALILETNWSMNNQKSWEVSTLIKPRITYINLINHGD